MTQQAIIVAGGKGTRMKGPIPKQFLELMGRPVVMHTIEKFYLTSRNINIILVLPKAHHSTWQLLCKKHHFNLPHQLCEGGQSRFQSVKNGLKYCSNDGLIAVHDGVRPLVSPQLISELYLQSAAKNAVIPVSPLVESIRKVNGTDSKALDRNQYVSVQTPQCFKAEILHKAYNMPEKAHFTDDASVVEASGITVSLAQGEANNLKITTPKDLLLAESLLKNA